MSGCFISYSSVDRIIVEGLAEKLRNRRYEVWIDFEGIEGGAQWEEEIKKALEQSAVCIVAVTPDSVCSDWVKREIQMAKAAGKTIIPLIMRGDVSQDCIEELGISDLQHIDFVRYGLAAGMEQLLRVLPPPKTGSAPEATGLRGLIIEDVAVQQLAIKQVFHGLGIEAVTAHDFGSALKLIRGEPFNVVTLDMQLDEMDPGGQHGILLLDELRTYHEGVPVIIISGLDWTPRQVRDFLREYEAYDYLPKPFNPNELRRIIEAALASP